MSIEQQLNADMKTAMRAKDTKKLSVVRMVKAFATREKTSPGFQGTMDDAFWTDVVAKYVKQQQKAIAEFEKLGAGNDEQVEQMKFEVAYLSPFLPACLSEEETARLVDEAILATGADNPKLLGKVMGYIMKSHKDQVDGAMLKQLISQKLS